MPSLRMFRTGLTAIQLIEKVFAYCVALTKAPLDSSLGASGYSQLRHFARRSVLLLSLVLLVGTIVLLSGPLIEYYRVRELQNNPALLQHFLANPNSPRFEKTITRLTSSAQGKSALLNYGIRVLKRRNRFLNRAASLNEQSVVVIAIHSYWLHLDLQETGTEIVGTRMQLIRKQDPLVDFLAQLHRLNGAVSRFDASEVLVAVMTPEAKRRLGIRPVYSEQLFTGSVFEPDSALEIERRLKNQKLFIVLGRDSLLNRRRNR